MWRVGVAACIVMGNAMKRLLRTLAVFLLLGAIVNFGIALGCAALLDCKERAPIAIGVRDRFGRILSQRDVLQSERLWR